MSRYFFKILSFRKKTEDDGKTGRNMRYQERQSKGMVKRQTKPDPVKTMTESSENIGAGIKPADGVSFERDWDKEA